MDPGVKPLAGFSAIDEEVDPGGTALEAILAIGKQVNVLVAHPMVACHMSPSGGRTAIHNQLSACLHLCTTHCILSVQLSGVAGFNYVKRSDSDLACRWTWHYINVRHRLGCHLHVLQYPMP